MSQVARDWPPASAAASVTPRMLALRPTRTSRVRAKRQGEGQAGEVRRERSGVGPGDPLGDADRLVAALALDGDGEGVLQAAGDLLHVLERHAGPDLRAHRYRGGEAHLVQAVVHAHLRVADRVGL